jgi:hypothetical protein
MSNNKGNNTGNSLIELIAIKDLIDKKQFDFDGCDPEETIKNINEDIKQLTKQTQTT